MWKQDTLHLRAFFRNPVSQGDPRNDNCCVRRASRSDGMLHVQTRCETTELFRNLENFLKWFPLHRASLVPLVLYICFREIKFPIQFRFQTLLAGINSHVVLSRRMLLNGDESSHGADDFCFLFTLFTVFSHELDIFIKVYIAIRFYYVISAITRLHGLFIVLSKRILASTVDERKRNDWNVHFLLSKLLRSAIFIASSPYLSLTFLFGPVLYALPSHSVERKNKFHVRVTLAGIEARKSRITLKFN